MVYFCATPLGNLGDITLRTLETLRSVDLIFAEDTRRSRILLNHYEIKKPLYRYDDHTEIEGSMLEQAMEEGKDMAIITDAGMPLISDPGYELIQYCLKKEIPFEVQPGPSAVLLALSNSGLPSHRFSFMGFLPRKKKERLELLEEIKERKETLIFYETPHRIEKPLEDLHTVFGNRQAALLREMTKLYEEAIRLPLEDLITEIKERPRKGEMVLVVQGWSEEPMDLPLEEYLDEMLGKGYKTKEIATNISKTYGITGSEAYKLVLERKKQ